MFTNRYFTVNILIGKVPVPEYVKDGHFYVESNLNTPLSYNVRQVEDVGGDTESQESPVTPYQIKITAHSGGYDQHYFRVMVDGVKVKGVTLEAGQSKVIKGFRDGGIIRELLFSMPRFARDETDRLVPQRQSSIGKIVVECWKATLKSRKCGMRPKYLDFEQANKKDSTAVTKGEYLMATSRAGKRVCDRSQVRDVDYWKLNELLNTVTIQYHMAHTLRDMGITLQPFTMRPHLHTRNHALLAPKVEVKSEPDILPYSGRRKRRRRNRATRDTNSHEVAAALLALGGADGEVNDTASSSRAPPDLTPSCSGPPEPELTQPPQLSRESTPTEQLEDDMEEDFEEDDLEIVEVRPGNKKRKSSSGEPALIDLTEDSDTEGNCPRASKKIRFEVKEEVKLESKGKASSLRITCVKSTKTVNVSQNQPGPPTKDSVAGSTQDSGLGDELDCSNPTEKSPTPPIKDSRNNSESADKMTSDIIENSESTEKTTNDQHIESTNSSNKSPSDQDVSMGNNSRNDSESTHSMTSDIIVNSESAEKTTNSQLVESTDPTSNTQIDEATGLGNDANFTDSGNKNSSDQNVSMGNNSRNNSESTDKMTSDIIENSESTEKNTTNQLIEATDPTSNIQSCEATGLGNDANLTDSGNKSPSGQDISMGNSSQSTDAHNKIPTYEDVGSGESEIVDKDISKESLVF